MMASTSRRSALRPEFQRLLAVPTNLFLRIKRTGTDGAAAQTPALGFWTVVQSRAIATSLPDEAHLRARVYGLASTGDR